MTIGDCPKLEWEFPKRLCCGALGEELGMASLTAEVAELKDCWGMLFNIEPPRDCVPAEALVLGAQAVAGCCCCSELLN